MDYQLFFAGTKNHVASVIRRPEIENRDKTGAWGKGSLSNRDADANVDLDGTALSSVSTRPSVRRRCWRWGMMSPPDPLGLPLRNAAPVLPQTSTRTAEPNYRLSRIRALRLAPAILV